MISTEEALRIVLDRVQPLGTERLALEQAPGRVLRTAARADTDSPPFDASAMDGYAARRADLGHPLRLAGTSAAGTAFSRPVGPGECVRIFTGAPVPAGADCVVRQEDTTRAGDSICVTQPNGPVFIRRRGENRRAGDMIVPAGTVLGPAELAALAGAGVTAPEVARAPRCFHLVTGDELVPPGVQPTGAQIRDSNSTLIAMLLAQRQVPRGGHAHVRDDLAVAQSILAAGPAPDLLLISGGASVGDHDLARPLLKALGYELHFEQVNLRPGRPLVFASRGDRLAFALPGNPVSHWVTFHLFVAPLLQKLQTGADSAPVRLTGRLSAGSRLPPPDQRRTFWPARTVIVDGGYEVTPLPLASSGDGSGLVGANALLAVVENCLDPGQPVEFIPCP